MRAARVPDHARTQPDPTRHGVLVQRRRAWTPSEAALVMVTQLLLAAICATCGGDLVGPSAIARRAGPRSAENSRFSIAGDPPYGFVVDGSSI